MSSGDELDAQSIAFVAIELTMGAIAEVYEQHPDYIGPIHSAQFRHNNPDNELLAVISYYPMTDMVVITDKDEKTLFALKRDQVWDVLDRSKSLDDYAKSTMTADELYMLLYEASPIAKAEFVC